MPRNKVPISEKINAIKDILEGRDSQRSVAKRCGVALSSVQRWTMKYQSMGEIAFSTNRNKRYSKGRTTTFDERIEIAAYCISHDHNYAETAEKFEVSYQQARNYTVKYESNGIEGLKDNRGKRKSEDELTEIERLHAELKLEKAKRQRAEMEASFLKNSTK